MRVSYLAGFLAGGRAGPRVAVELGRTGAHLVFIVVFLVEIHATRDTFKVIRQGLTLALLESVFLENLK